MSAHHWIEAAGAALLALAWFAAEVGINAALRVMRGEATQDDEEKSDDPNS